MAVETSSLSITRVGFNNRAFGDERRVGESRKHERMIARKRGGSEGATFQAKFYANGPNMSVIESVPVCRPCLVVTRRASRESVCSRPAIVVEVLATHDESISPTQSSLERECVFVAFDISFIS